MWQLEHLPFPVEERFAEGDITSDRVVRGRGSQNGEMGDDRVDLGGGER